MSIPEADVLAAFKAAANAALTSPGRAYSLYEVDQMASKPSRYVELNVVQRPRLTAGRANPGRDMGWWRVTVRGVADVDTNVRAMLSEVRGAVEFKQLTIGSASTSPIEYETGTAVEQDDDWWSGLHVWTFTL